MEIYHPTLKLTPKCVKESHTIVVPIGYCDIHYLLRSVGAPRLGYTQREEGWAADIYSFFHNGYSIALATGYNPFGNGKAFPQTVKKFEETARHNMEKDAGGYFRSEHAIAVFDDFLSQILRENGLE